MIEVLLLLAIGYFTWFESESTMSVMEPPMPMVETVPPSVDSAEQAVSAAEAISESAALTAPMPQLKPDTVLEVLPSVGN